MIDLSKPIDEKTLDNIPKLYRLSVYPFLLTIILLPIAVGYILYFRKIHTYLIVSSVVIIILVEYYMVMKYLKKQRKKK